MQVELLVLDCFFWLLVCGCSARFTESAKQSNRRRSSSNEMEDCCYSNKHTSFNAVSTEPSCSAPVTVYKGMLEDGVIVAVKKSKALEEENLEEFINEIILLSQINHRSIVKILGCCLETEVPMLVYEFIPNRNLFDHLHNPSDDFPMTWEVRLRIAWDVADALSYLHSAASVPIYHRDVKSTNILLDEKHRAKVSDFGISRSVPLDDTHLTTVVKGTVGYVDPEYLQSNHFTGKSDVYSFGVVLIELVTGGRPVSLLRPQEVRMLGAYFLEATRNDRLHDVLDHRRE